MFVRLLLSPPCVAVAAIAVASALPGAPHWPTFDGAERARIDTVYIARDLDGSGKTDYVVRESKPAMPGSARAYRIAIYLDGAPGKRRPQWASRWDDESGYELLIGQAFAVDAKASLIEVKSPQADYDATWIVLVDRGKARTELTHGIDYGHGFLAMTKENGRVVVDATLDNLEVRGSPVPATVECAGTDWAASRFTFDAASRHFVAEPSRCVAMR